MKRLNLYLLFLFALAALVGPRFAFADPIAPSLMIDEGEIYLHAGPLNLITPVKSGVSIVALIDLIHNGKPYAGVETPFAMTPHQHFVFTIGGVTDVEAQGTPFLGGHVRFLNAPQALAWLNEVDIGAFGARNFNQGFWMAGGKLAKRFATWGKDNS